MNIPASISLDQFLLIVAIVVGLTILWLVVRAVLRLAMRIFAIGCALILLVAMVLLILFFLGFLG
jgi:hypothetical protein